MRNVQSFRFWRLCLWSSREHSSWHNACTRQLLSNTSDWKQLIVSLVSLWGVVLKLKTCVICNMLSILLRWEVMRNSLQRWKRMSGNRWVVVDSWWGSTRMRGQLWSNSWVMSSKSWKGLCQSVRRLLRDCVVQFSTLPDCGVCQARFWKWLWDMLISVSCFDGLCFGFLGPLLYVRSSVVVGTTGIEKRDVSFVSRISYLRRSWSPTLWDVDVVSYGIVTMRSSWIRRSVAESGRLEERWRWKLTDGIGTDLRELVLVDLNNEIFGGEGIMCRKKLLSSSLWRRVYYDRDLKEVEAALFVVKHLIRD